MNYADYTLELACEDALHLLPHIDSDEHLPRKCCSCGRTTLAVAPLGEQSGEVIIGRVCEDCKGNNLRAIHGPIFRVAGNAEIRLLVTRVLAVDLKAQGGNTTMPRPLNALAFIEDDYLIFPAGDIDFTADASV